jgi:hypothetical protein
MSQHTVTANSGANAAQTVTLTPPFRQGNAAPYKKLVIHSITVTTSGGDIAADIGILLTKPNSETWNAELRSAKVFGGHFDFSHPIDCGHGVSTIVVDAGGANVVTTCSVQYEIL